MKESNANIQNNEVSENVEEKEITEYDLKEIFGDLLKITDEDLERTFRKFEKTHFSEDIF